MDFGDRDEYITRKQQYVLVVLLHVMYSSQQCRWVVCLGISNSFIKSNALYICYTKCHRNSLMESPMVYWDILITSLHFPCLWVIPLKLCYKSSICLQEFWWKVYLIHSCFCVSASSNVNQALGRPTWQSSTFTWQLRQYIHFRQGSRWGPESTYGRGFLHTHIG